MNPRLTVSIGMTAYNEAANIRPLLSALLLQREDGYTLKEILVISDGSTDATAACARSVRDPRLHVSERHDRQGQQARQNELLRTYQGDILVLMEADTLPANDRTIAELVRPFWERSSSNLGMVVGSTLLVPPRSFLEIILLHEDELKQAMFAELEEGRDDSHVYACRGQAMKALSGTFARQLSWPADVPEDAYAYFAARQRSLRVLKQPAATVYMKGVSTLSDRVRQYAKFSSGRDVLKACVPPDVVHAAYALPRRLIAKQVFRAVRRKPLWTLLGLFEMAWTRACVMLRHPSAEMLAVPAKSSKDLGILARSRWEPGSTPGGESVSVGAEC
ncbi:MAG: glycosyltransferase [bacterium]|nr:glycosyltransferase [bacterium]